MSPYSLSGHSGALVLAAFEIDGGLGAIFFVPLHDDAILHRRRLQRHDGIKLPLADHHAAGMLAQMPRQILNCLIKLKELSDAIWFELPRSHLVAENSSKCYTHSAAVRCLLNVDGRPRAELSQFISIQRDRMPANRHARTTQIRRLAAFRKFANSTGLRVAPDQKVSIRGAPGAAFRLNLPSG